MSILLSLTISIMYTRIHTATDINKVVTKVPLFSHSCIGLTSLNDETKSLHVLQENLAELANGLLIAENKTSSSSILNIISAMTDKNNKR